MARPRLTRDLRARIAADPYAESLGIETLVLQFFDAARAGRALVAEAREERLGRRAVFYAMTVADDAGRTIATCQGVVHRRPAERGS